VDIPIYSIWNLNADLNSFLNYMNNGIFFTIALREG